MQVVIYSLQFEPITVLEMPIDLYKQIKEKGKGILKVATNDPKNPFTACRIILVRYRWINNEEIDIFTTLDEEVALAIEPSWLPGHRSTINFTIKNVRKMKDRIIDLMKRLGEA